MGLVADDDRVGVGDPAGVAHEPLVGLDRHGAVGGVVVVEQRRADPVAVAAVAQLAVELVDEVAAVGEDQDAAGPRGLDEAQRGDRLAGAGGVLEPEAPVGVGILGLLVELTSSSLVLVLPVLGLLVLGLVLVVEVELGVLFAQGSPPRPSSVAARAPARRCRRWPLPLPLPLRCASASSAVSVPDRAST